MHIAKGCVGLLIVMEFKLAAELKQQSAVCKWIKELWGTCEIPDLSTSLVELIRQITKYSRKPRAVSL